MVFVRHLLLAASLALLLGAGIRAASQLTSVALERVVAAAPLAASIAAVEALGLGVAGLGTTPGVLFGGAVAAYLVARRLVPESPDSLGQQLGSWWKSLSTGGRFAAGAAAGAVAAWTVWLLKYPAFGWDNLAYHIPEVVAWVRNGSPGSIVPLVPGWPYGNFPVTNEVLLSWGSGIGRSFVWITVWPGLMFALLAASGWLGLRVLRVPVLPRVLATASLCAAPMLTSYQHNGANSDLPAMVWLLVAAALCAVCLSEERMGLLAPALLAAALAVGTKTTAAPLAGIVVAVAIVRLRGRLRPLRVPLAVAAGAALVVGGTWYVRNLIQHGSPLWPFFSTPSGDAIPQLVGHPEELTFFQRPLASLARFGDSGYVTDNFLGALIALAAALMAPLLVRQRAVAACAMASAVSLFLWTLAPDTGAPRLRTDFTGAFYASPRLLMPGVAVATLTLALAARDARRTRPLWIGLLLAILVVNVSQLFQLGFPAVPGARTPVAGALVGGALALAARQLPWRGILRPLGLAGCALALGAMLALAAPHLVERHWRLGIERRTPYIDAVLIGIFLHGPGADGRPIHSSPIMMAMLAGNDLSRPLAPIPLREPCRRIADRTRTGWVVVVKAIDPDQLFGPTTTRKCVDAWRAQYDYGFVAVYGGRSVPPASRGAPISSG
jgi:hypothetical protein